MKQPLFFSLITKPITICSYPNPVKPKEKRQNKENAQSKFQFNLSSLKSELKKITDPENKDKTIENPLNQ